MRVVLSWLQDFAPVGDDIDALADQLSMLGMAVDGVEVVGAPVDGVIVARVLATRPHPDADKVHLVDVDTGDGEALQIVCGAFNMTAGDLVPLATLGTAMPNGMEIGRRKMRGEWSNGMLCSSRELGLGDDHAGILLLPAELPLGQPVFDALGVTADAVFDLDITRNRPDAWSHRGVARDLAAHLAVPFVDPSPPLVIEGPERIATVTIEAPDLCGRFTSTVITGVRIGPSAPWMAERLTRAGMRPINNVVDVSNYVMLELGQPSHPYDLAKLPGGGFRVRRARAGETLVTLDDVTRELVTDDLLICDALDQPVGIAGIMGGASSEIDDGTTEVALEMAWFDPVAIATTAARLGLRSEASARFERGVDPMVADRAIARFVELLRETSPAAAAPGLVDARGELPAPAVVRVRPERVSALLGTRFEMADIARLIEPIGFVFAGDEVTVPSWRPDCAVEVDIAEEVARHYGYARLGKTVPTSAHPGRLTGLQHARRLIRQVLVGAGLDEAMPDPLLAPDDLARAGLDPVAIRLTNPLAAEGSILRPSLRPGLLESIAYNASHRTTGVALFELGHVFRPPPAGQLLPDEREVIGAALSGREAPAAAALWAELAAALGVDGAELVADATVAGMHATRTGRLVAADGTVLGAVGEIDPGVLERYGIGERVAWLEVDLVPLVERGQPDRPYHRVSRYPSSDLDLAFVLDESVPAATLTSALRVAGGDTVTEVRLFDVYRGPGLAGGQRGLAYRLRLQATDRTLTDADVAEVRGRCITAAAAIGASLRA